MTTLALDGPRTGPSLARVIGAEWTKVLGLRSSAVVVVVTALVSGAVTYLSANASSSDPGFDPLDSLTTGLPVAVIGPLVLGVLVGTGEFSTFARVQPSYDANCDDEPDTKLGGPVKIADLATAVSTAFTTWTFDPNTTHCVVLDVSLPDDPKINQVQGDDMTFSLGLTLTQVIAKP